MVVRVEEVLIVGDKGGVEIDQQLSEVYLQVFILVEEAVLVQRLLLFFERLLDLEAVIVHFFLLSVFRISCSLVGRISSHLFLQFFSFWEKFLGYVRNESWYWHNAHLVLNLLG